MSKSIRRFLSLLLVLQLIIPYTTFAAAVGEFSSVVGNVTQTRAKEVITPIVKSPIQMKDLIATALTSSATMVFSDDSTIKLSENTKLEIKEFLFKDKSRRGIFSLAIGKMAADVKKYIGGDNVFEVQSPTAVVGVRGTGFDFDEAVTPEKMGKATVACTEGSLNLSALGPAGGVVSSAVLLAGHVAVITAGVITISAIGAAATAAEKSTETTAAAAAGGTGSGDAAAGAGLSTGAKIGIGAGAIVAVGLAAAAIGGGGGGGGSSTPTPTPPPTPTATLEGTWSNVVGPITDSSGAAHGACTSGSMLLNAGGTANAGDWNCTRRDGSARPTPGSGNWTHSGTTLRVNFSTMTCTAQAQSNATSFAMTYNTDEARIYTLPNIIKR